MKTAPPSTKPDLLLHYDQQVVIFKSLKRFEKLKIDYSKQYRIGLRKDTILAVLRDKVVDRDSIIARYQKQIWKEGVAKQKAQKNERIWQQKAHKRNVKFLTLLGLVLSGFTYERIH